jgi:hypothetical protein
MSTWRCGSKKREGKENYEIEVRMRNEQFWKEGRKIRGVSLSLLG